MRRLPLVFLALTACGGPLKPSKLIPKSVPKVSKDMPSLPDDETALSLLTHEFYADAQALDVATERDVKSISFVNEYPVTDEDQDAANRVGQCETHFYEDGIVAYKTITLLESFWDNASFQTKRTLIYHELCHCALECDHTPPKVVAIMAPELISDEVASKNWLDLAMDMFLGNNR